MVTLVRDRPVVDEAVVVPDFINPKEALDWLTERASGDQLSQVREQGSCPAQVLTRVEQLSEIMGIPVRKFR